jgi:RNA ligase (TIGR02306 family)
MKENRDSVCFCGRVEEIKPIEGAEKLELGIISGWECVMQKNMCSVGQLVVLATTDAVIPQELADGLGITTYLKNRKKTGQLTVKTTKLRGVYSQAIIIDDIPKAATEGQDMMKYYNISKYEEPEQIITSPGGKKIRWQSNPHFHVYYKFPNAKNAPGMFTEEDDVIATNKIHGTNARYSIAKKNKLSIIDRVKLKLSLFKFTPENWKWVDMTYIYGSHNVEKGSDSNGYYSTDVWRGIAEREQIKEKLWVYVKTHGRQKIGEGIILYGEIFGEGIQKYYEYGTREHKIKFFDIKQDGHYISVEEFNSICKELNLEKVEVLYEGKFDEEKIKSFLNRNIPNTKVPEEGVIVKSITGDRSKIAKWINPAYLEFQSKKEDSTDFH